MKGPLGIRILVTFCVVGTLFVQYQTISTNPSSDQRYYLRGDVALIPRFQSIGPSRRLQHGRRLGESGGLVRFAWGIFSRPEDEDLREGLRETYLNDPRICILTDSEPLNDNCQIAYTFVLPLEVLQDEKRLVPPAKDLTYLPESNRLTLVSSWFRYAANAEVGYVVKVDATTLVFPDKFLEMAQDTLGLSSMRRVVGGVPKDRWDCGGFSKWKCRQMQATYMSPTLYFLSTDLAKKIPFDIVDEAPERLADWLMSATPQLPTIQVPIQPSHGLWEVQGSRMLSVELQKRWNYLKSHQFAKHLIQSEETNLPRWNGTSFLDEFYRRIPWKYIPNAWTRFDLP